MMNCIDLDPVVCDYIDGTLPRAQREQVELHLAACAACNELVADARGALAFIDGAADVDLPPELVTKILQQVPAGGRVAGAINGAFNGVLGRFFGPIFQPRVVMGAMLTVLSLSMMTRCAGAPSHPLSTADLDPVRLWAALDDKVHRGWDRTVKTYESMRLVYEVRSRVTEWSQREQEEEAESQKESRRLPQKVTDQKQERKAQ